MKKYTLKSGQQTIHTRINYDTELNDEQRSVVVSANGPCLVLAGAGSGKTRTLVYLTAFLLEQKIPPQNIMLVTFTNKAAHEMLSRVEMLLRERPKGLWGGTFHHLANRILRKYAQAVGFDNNFAILDEDDSKNFLKSTIAEMKIDTKREKFPKPDIIHSIISFKQNSMLSFHELIEDKYPYIPEKYRTEIEKIYELFQQKKKSANSMNFDDLLYYWRKILYDNNSIAKNLSAQFRHILVDEYQDTNKIQADIVRKLSETHKNTVVVGDDSQSIYSFRAANVNNILDFPKLFPETKIFKLETNYRSSPEILALANCSIQNNSRQFEKKLKSVKDSRSRPNLVPLQDSYQQAEFIVQRILEMADEGEKLDDMAVLFRSAFHALELELELNKKGIPYEMRGGIRFFEQAHIKDVIAFLRFFNNVKDEIALKRVAVLYPGIGSAGAQKIWECVQRHDNIEHILSDTLPLPDRQLKGWNEIRKIFGKMLALQENFISSAIELILRSGYQKHLESAFENAKDRIEDLEQLANFSVSYKNLEDFLSEITLSEAFKGQTEAATDETEKEKLTLTTIHQAKGLEWKTVFLIGLVEGQFPHYKVFEKPQEMEEERRLFYVASTRAKDELYLTYPIISFSYRTGQNINRPSLFLKEIREELMEKWEVDSQNDLPTIFYDEKLEKDDSDPGIIQQIQNL